MLLVLGVPLVEVLGRALAAADTHIAVLAADDQLKVAAPLDDDLSHPLLHATGERKDIRRAAHLLSCICKMRS